MIGGGVQVLMDAASASPLGIVITIDHYRM